MPFLSFFPFAGPLPTPISLLHEIAAGDECQESNRGYFLCQNKTESYALSHVIWVSVSSDNNAVMDTGSCSECGLEIKKAGQCGEELLCVLGRRLLGRGPVGPARSHLSLGLSLSL